MFITVALRSLLGTINISVISVLEFVCCHLLCHEIFLTLEPGYFEYYETLILIFKAFVLANLL